MDYTDIDAVKRKPAPGAECDEVRTPGSRMGCGGRKWGYARTEKRDIMCL